jgi:hypothetical protein
MNALPEGRVQKVGFVVLLIVLATMSVAPGILSVVGSGWVAAPALGWALVAAALLGTGLVIALKRPVNEPAMVATLPLLATAALVLTIIAFLVAPEAAQRMAPLVGCTLALLTWRLVAELCRGCLNAEYCNASSYGELQHRLTELDAILKDPQMIDAKARSSGQQAWLKAAQDQSAAIKMDFADGKQSDLKWVLATGYINQWKRLHCAEESLFEVLPDQQVVAAAIGDELRLIGSRVDSRDELLAKLRHAVVTIDPAAGSFLRISTDQGSGFGAAQVPSRVVQTAAAGNPPPGSAGSVPTNPAPLSPPASGAAKQGGVGSPAEEMAAATQAALAAGSQRSASGAPLADGDGAGGGGPPPPAAKQTARSILRVVRGTVNEYEDDRYDGLVVARNLTWRTSTYTGATAFLLFAVAVFAGATRTAIVGAITFYLVGAIVGLLVRLRGEMSQEQDVSDYGLSNARLYAMPLFCGLAAVGGVLLMAMVPAAAGALTTLSPNEASGAAPTAIASLPRIFDLSHNLQGLLVSALFGMTPELLFSRLQQLTEKYKTEIKAVGSAQKAGS